MELALLFKVEFWRVNFWQLLLSPPNPPKYSPTKILRYTVSGKSRIMHHIWEAKVQIYTTIYELPI